MDGGSLGKRAKYELKPRDKYFTPYEAVVPLDKVMEYGFSFCEPCAGDGRLVHHIEQLLPGTLCPAAFDIEPNANWVLQKDALDLTEDDVMYCDYIITNPPFTYSILKPLMEKFISLRPTILLLPADYMHNIRMAPFMWQCEWVKSIGRVRWVEGSKTTGVDNFAWFKFNKDNDQHTQFFGRT